MIEKTPSPKPLIDTEALDSLTGEERKRFAKELVDIWEANQGTIPMEIERIEQGMIKGGDRRSLYLTVVGLIKDLEEDERARKELIAYFKVKLITLVSVWKY